MIVEKQTDQNDQDISFLEEDEKLEIIYKKLDIISNIKVDEKLIIAENEICIDDRYFQWLRRWYNNDNRYLSLMFVESIILTALEYETLVEQEIKKYQAEKQSIKSPWKKQEDHIVKKLDKLDVKILKLTDFSDTITKNINKSCTGLNNLMNTYSEDALIIPRLKSLLSKIGDNDDSDSKNKE